MDKLRNKAQDFWNRALLSGLMLNIVVFLASAWVLENYYQVSVIGRLSFLANDPTWMPPPQVSHPIFGIHHFGDYQIMTGYANDPNPYKTSLTLPAQYLPFTFVLVRGFQLFGLRGGLLLYSALVTVCLVYTCLYFLRKATPYEKITFLSLVLFLSQPFITATDRGNLQGLMTGIIGVAYVLWKKGKSGAAFSFFLLACLFKGYPILLLLFIKRKTIRNFFAMVLATAVVSLLSFSLLHVGLLEGVKGYLFGIKLNQSSCLTCGYSISSFANKFFLFFFPALKSSIAILLIDSLLILGWFIFCLWLVHKFVLPEWLGAFVALSCLQILPGLANNFTLLWAVIAAAIFYQGHSGVTKSNRTIEFPNLLIVQLLVLATFLFTLGPNCWLFHGPRNYATWLTSILSPMFVLLTILSIPFFADRNSQEVKPDKRMNTP